VSEQIPAVNRRQLCAAVGGCLTTATGCLGSNRTTTTVDEPTDTRTATAIDGSTQTRTAPGTEEPTGTPTTETIPPYSRSLHELRVENGRGTSVRVRVVIRHRDTDDDERTLQLRLDPGGSRTYENLDLLAEPVDVQVTVGDETATYTPQSGGVVTVVVTTDDTEIQFEEAVT
jgi:hypothetical protein